MSPSLSHAPLETLDREDLLKTVRRLLGEADSLSSRISAVNEIGVAMNSTLDIDTIQKVVAKQAKWLLDFTHLSVCRQENGLWQVTTLFGPPEEPLGDLEQAINVKTVLEKGEPNLIQQGSPSPFLANYASQMLLPLSADNMVLGSINFATTKPNAYNQDDMRIGYMLSLQLSAAMRNARIVAILQATQNELKLRIEELDAYGHTIAHDLKTPLSNILLWSELLKIVFGERLPPESLHYVETIHASGKMMHRMIDQLLQLARLHHTPQSMKTVHVRAAIDTVLLRFQPQIEEGKITLAVAPEIPDAVGHEQWIEEIFANLISNAIKYMGEANPAPRIDISAVAKDNMVSYSVKDTGVGIKAEDRERIFEKFSRLRSLEVEGMGLGLSIIYRMITQLGGQITVESQPGEGSTFSFTLPAAPSAQAEMKEGST